MTQRKGENEPPRGFLAPSDAPHRWPGPVLPDAALSGLARPEGADWSGRTRRSLDGEDVDPGEPWKPAD